MDENYQHPIHRLIRQVIGIVLVAIVLPAIILWFLVRPTGLYPPQEVQIQRGMGAGQIGELLQEKGLIRHAKIFALAARLQGVAQDLEAGTYQLDGRYDTPTVLQELLKAPLEMQRLTIPEGLTRHEIASLLQQQGFANSSDFIARTEDQPFIATLGLEVPTLEGYLFPETYFYSPGQSADGLIKQMVHQFHQVFNKHQKGQLATLDMTRHQIVTLASIVEREAMVANERPVIAAVFHRRLKLNRRLESCATVEFALGVHKKRLTNADLEVVSPYNTYRHRGLPPHPIANPGAASLKATLNPSKSDYLYFVARGDGTHTFSRTNKEHNTAKRAIRLEERRRSKRN